LFNMVVRTYTFFDTNSVVTGSGKSVTLDFFSTLADATLNWNVGSGFKSIVFNGKTVSTQSSGSANVVNMVMNGQQNKVQVNTSVVLFPSAKVTLSVNGILATFEVVLEQNRVFVSAFQTKQISEDHFKKQINFQNNVAASMLQNGVITSSEYAQLVAVFNDFLKKPDDNGSGGSGGSGGGSGGGGSGGWWDWLTGGSGGSGGGSGSGGGDDDDSGSKSFWSAKNAAVIVVVVVVVLISAAVLVRWLKK
jgi:hypothetical protein